MVLSPGIYVLSLIKYVNFAGRWIARYIDRQTDGWMGTSLRPQRVTCALGRLSLALVVRQVTVMRQQAADNLQETDKLDRCTDW